MVKERKICKKESSVERNEVRKGGREGGKEGRKTFWMQSEGNEQDIKQKSKPLIVHGKANIQLLKKNKKKPSCFQLITTLSSVLPVKKNQ